MGGTDRFGEAEQVFPPLPLSPAQPVTECRLHHSNVKLNLAFCKVLPYAMRLGVTESFDWVDTGIRFRVQGSKFRVQGSGFQAEGVGWRAEGRGNQVVYLCSAPWSAGRRIFDELMMPDRKLNAFREGSK